MTWNEDHAKFKMADILFHQILFLFTSRFIIDIGSPWAIICPHAPPLLHHFDQGTVHDINDVAKEKMGRDMGFGHFSKLSQRKSNLGHSYIAKKEKSKMAASKNNFMTK